MSERMMDRICYGIAAVVVLMVVGSLAWLGYVVYLEPKIHTQLVLITTPLPHIRVPTVTVPTSTPKATSTPKPPTVTPILPTRTPRPTATARPTPNPTPTPTPGYSAEEQAYIAKIKEILWDYTIYLSKLGELSNEVSRYPWLFSDAEWRGEMSWVLAAFLVRGKNLRALEPPARYRGSHQDYVQMSRHYDTMCDLITQSIDEVNPDKIKKSVEEMYLAGDYFKQGAAKFQQESRLE